MTKCGICYHFHNHFHCPTCAAVKVGSQYFSAITGREMVKARGITKQALSYSDTPDATIAQVTSRLVRATNLVRAN